MCSLSSHHKQVMNDYAAIGGDLTDIFQAGAPPVLDIQVDPLPSSSLTAGGWGDLASISCNNNVVSGEDFGDPFSDTGNPLLRDGDAPSPFTLPLVEGEDGRRAERIKAPSSYGVFARILQITATPSEASPLGGDFSYANGPSLLTSTMTEDHGMVRIPSPRNNPIMKRRKIQGKKVVCIPAAAAAAAAAANSMPSSGEVVPSDLWAWRKYGQKPIKGSPFPRGYYRCSSLKGCLARKQVERSRTNPNMLVITYTSEHNHPWPSQRNALAGLTRSTLKGSSGSKNSVNSSRTVKSEVVKGEKSNGNSSNDSMSCTAAVVAGSLVKEETDNVGEKPFDAEDTEFDGVGLAHCYQPSLMDRADHHPDDFFADLGEIEADPYELLFKRGFPVNDRKRGNKSTEYPFNLLDWADDNNGVASFHQAND